MKDGSEEGLKKSRKRQEGKGDVRLTDFLLQDHTLGQDKEGLPICDGFLSPVLHTSDQYLGLRDTNILPSMVQLLSGYMRQQLGSHLYYVNISQTNLISVCGFTKLLWQL